VALRWIFAAKFKRIKRIRANPDCGLIGSTTEQKQFDHAKTTGLKPSPRTFGRNCVCIDIAASSLRLYHADHDNSITSTSTGSAIRVELAQADCDVRFPE
jgi:hypothetical protein